MPVQGLLQKANLLQNEGLAFFDFISKHKIQHCAFLTTKPLNYSITYSYGFDAESIFSSISTLDFWTGTIPEKNKIYTFSTINNSINIILQLFSPELKEVMEEVSIIRLSDNSIFILGNQKINNSIISDIKLVKFEKTPKKQNSFSTFNKNLIIKNYDLSFTNFVEDFFITKKLNSNLIKIFSETVYKEIQLRLFFSFNDYSSITSNTLKNYKITIQELKELPYKLIKTHIISILNDVLPVDEDNIIIAEV